MTQGDAELRFGHDLRENSSVDLLFLLIYLVMSFSVLFNSLLLKLNAWSPICTFQCHFFTSDGETSEPLDILLLLSNELFSETSF